MQFILSVLYLAAAVAGRAVNKRASGSRTSPPSGCLVVRGSGTESGEYSTLSSAVAALSGDDACIFMYSGTYAEKVTLDYSGSLTLYGYTEESVLSQ